MKPYLNIPYILEKGEIKSITELSKKLGVHRMTVSNWNNKKGNPGLKDIMNICDLVNTRNINEFILYK